VVTTSTTTLAFEWPSALTAQLIVSIRHIENPPPQGLGAARVPLAKASTNGHGQGVAQRGAAVHGKGDSERLDLVMINPTTERLFHRTATAAALQKLHELLPVETRNN
jgi:hypothetical protein